MSKKISVIIPVRNEENYIKECLDSIIKFDYNKEFLEVLIVDGMSEDNTVNIIESYIKQYPYIKLLKNQKKIVPVAMNIGLKEAKGDFICRLDCHAKYPDNYIKKLLHWIEKLDADNVGAVCITGIKSQTSIAKAIQFVMSDKFGVGNSLFRLGVEEPLEVDTVPFGFYKKDIFKKIGFYDERLVRVQDLELNKRLKKHNGKIFLIPDIQCVYYPREKFKEFFINRFETGRWVILSSYYTNSLKSVSLRHMVPLFFTFSLFFTLLFSIVSIEFLYLFGIILFGYSFILFFRALSIKKNIFLSFYILIGYFVLHLSYGLGSLKGFFETVFRKKEHN